MASPFVLRFRILDYLKFTAAVCVFLGLFRWCGGDLALDRGPLHVLYPLAVSVLWP